MYLLFNIYTAKVDPLRPVILYKKVFETLNEAAAEMNRQVDDAIVNHYNETEILKLLRVETKVRINTKEECDWWQIIKI